MVELKLKNLKEVEDSHRNEVEQICKEKSAYFHELFKKYKKDLVLEIIFDHSSSTYKVSASINLKSKKIIVAEEGKDILEIVTKLLNEFKKVVKRRYELERKDYEYKRKR
ncbi:hypothetical protein [Lutibacter sp.]